MTERHAPTSGLQTVLLAGLAGAGLALLFAPRKGSETRQMLREAAETAKSRAQDDLTSVRHTAQDMGEKAKDAQNKATSAIKSKAHSIKSSRAKDTALEDDEPIVIATYNEEK